MSDTRDATAVIEEQAARSTSRSKEREGGIRGGAMKKTLGCIVFWRRSLFPCRWDKRNQTLYASNAATLFPSRASARNHARRAIRWWNRWSKRNGFRQDHEDSDCILVVVRKS